MFSNYFISLFIEILLRSLKNSSEYTSDNKKYFYAKGLTIKNNNIIIEPEVEEDVFTSFMASSLSITLIAAKCDNILLNDINSIIEIMEKFNSKLVSKIILREISLN